MRNILLLSLFLIAFVTVSGQSVEAIKTVGGEEKNVLTDLPEPVIKIFPVPVLNNQFTVTSDTPFIFIRMTNIIGQEICRNRLRYPVTRKEIEFPGTEKGIYLVTIELEDHRKIVKKILVNNGR